MMAFLSKSPKNQAELERKTRSCPCYNQTQQLHRLMSENHLHPATPKGRIHMAMGLIHHSGRSGIQGERVRNPPACRGHEVGTARLRQAGAAVAPELCAGIGGCARRN